MSAEQDRVRQLASRIAQRVSENEGGADRITASGDELASVRQSIAELKLKLANIEEHLSHENSDSTEKRRQAYTGPEEGTSTEAAESERRMPPTFAHSPWLSGIYVPAAHPSQERFGVEEAAVSELVDFFEKEKVCELEPGGKPCTHCDMCSTRGF
jgi:hypothetical protein